MERGNTTRGGGRGEEGGTTGFEGTNPIKRKRAATGGNSRNSTLSMLTNQPRPCLVQCLSYLDSESIRQVCLLSKEYYDIIHYDPGMANTWKKLLEIRPSSSSSSSSSKDDNTNDVGRLDRLVDQLYHHRNELQLIQEIQIIDPHKFQYSDFDKIGAALQTFQLSGIVSLRMVSSSASILPKPSSLNTTFALFLWIFPLQNLRVVDLSNCRFDFCNPLLFFENCLEQITYSSIDNASAVQIIGTELKNWSSLKEISMDDSMFVGYNKGLSNMKKCKYSNKFLFWQCSSKVLRKVSIKNATYFSKFRRRSRTIIPVILPLPQEALIKFVRNGPPSLRYFRSDLTSDNREMLRLERPDIVFS